MSGSWREQVLCTADVAHLFEPIEDRDRHDGGLERITAARRICGGCPGRLACLAEGMERGEHGVWGGEYLQAGRVRAVEARPERGRRLAECGTASARARHRRWRETCAVCWPGEHDRPIGRPPRQTLQPHGTHAAYNRHRKWGETPCAECVLGERIYSRQKARERRERRRHQLDQSAVESRQGRSA